MSEKLDVEIIEYKDGKKVAISTYRAIDRSVIHIVLDVLSTASKEV